MLDSPTGLATTADAVEELISQPPSAAGSVEVSSTEVPITEQKVLFSTAAAVPVHRENISRRLTAIMRRMFATSTDASRPRRRYYPPHEFFVEDARIEREMHRL